MHLTDTHLVLLSAASQRDDGLLTRPAKLTGAALRTLEGSLQKIGAADPVLTRADQPHWRRDEADTPVGLRITPAALAALGIENAGAASNGPIGDNGRALVDAGTQRSMSSRVPRAGSKQAQLQAMLAEGATIDALSAALGWQSHTVRAALTRLRQGGLALTAGKNQQGKTTYRLGSNGQHGTSQDSDAAAGEAA